MIDRKPDAGGRQAASAAIREGRGGGGGLADKELCDQIEPKIMVVLGHMIILVVDRCRLHRTRASTLQDQEEVTKDTTHQFF